MTLPDSIALVGSKAVLPALHEVVSCNGCASSASFAREFSTPPIRNKVWGIPTRDLKWAWVSPSERVHTRKRELRLSEHAMIGFITPGRHAMNNAARLQLQWQSREANKEARQ